MASIISLKVQTRQQCRLIAPGHYQIRHSWAQQLTLALDLLDQRVDEALVGLGLLLGVGQELDAVLAHSRIPLKRYKSVTRHLKMDCIYIALLSKALYSVA